MYSSTYTTVQYYSPIVFSAEGFTFFSDCNLLYVKVTNSDIFNDELFLFNMLLRFKF